MELLNIVQENTGKISGAMPGFRLHKLEVYNWGTFDERVWTFLPHGETALLTGDVGSGKSTLVDALITLLVSPKKVAYNKAADSSAKERTVASYVRGYFRQKRDIEGIKQPDSLRDINHYSVLLATFQDKILSQYVTLVQFFWFQGTQGAPSRFYVVADKEMWITRDFSKFDRDVRVLKKRPKHSDSVMVFDDYSGYAEVFRPKLGIMQEQALDLFQQTISMKKVEALTEFVRTNMLEVPNTEEDVQKLIRHFHDLDRAHEAVLKTKNQIDLLKPIVENGKQCGNLESEQETLLHLRQAIIPWFAEQKIDLLTSEISKTEDELTRATAVREHAERIYKQIDEKIKKVTGEIYLNGGGALEALKSEIEKSKETLIHVQKNSDKYSIEAKQFGLTLPENLEVFFYNRRRFPELKSKEERLLGKLKEDLITAVTERDRAEKSFKQVNDEIESLRSRKSSIPREYIEKRKQLCGSLDIPEDELPFVGELLEVKEEENCWEGAIERLLHNFAISLLVPDKHYHSVMRWVDRTSLGMRLVYYRVQFETGQSVLGHLNPFEVSEKLNIKPNTPYVVWLSKELKQRFNHICCDDMEQFRRENYVITKAGQIKTSGKRHEKDDRYGINDRRRFVLGFSNEKKIAVLEANKQTLEEEVKFYNEEMHEIEKKNNESQKRLNAIGELEQIVDFSDIDTKPRETDIKDKEERKNQLEKGSNVLLELQKQLDKQEAEKKAQYGMVIKAQKTETTLENNLEKLKTDKVESIEIAMKATLDIKEHLYPVLKQQIASALENRELTLKNIEASKGVYQRWIEEEREKLLEQIQKLRSNIIKLMTEYKNAYPEETKELFVDMESLAEFERILMQLEKDGLPKFEKRFKDLLHENTINQIALFQNKLNIEQNNIKYRIEQINDSLNDIDYNDGRYIRLEYDGTYDSEIKDFRIQLKACTEGALTGTEDEQYAESKFLLVKAIIERFRGRPGETDNDERWRKKVIDVRNWFLFAASERWRETNEEYEHYTDSGGKSGGQKEKLAYTILAASLVYHFGLEVQASRPQSFRFVVIDEAFLKSSDESARFGLELFKRLDLQLLIVTPLLKIPTIAQFISHVGFVHHDDIKHQSMLRNISIEEYENERKMREMSRYVSMV